VRRYLRPRVANTSVKAAILLCAASGVIPAGLQSKGSRSARPTDDARSATSLPMATRRAADLVFACSRPTRANAWIPDAPYLL
jgi:hypothetical protein